MKKIVIRDNGTKRVMTVNSQPSKTDQSYKDDCDANNIIRKFQKGEMVTHLARVTGKFADVSDVPDLLASMERIEEAKLAFLQVPAKVRAKFDNDVSKFYDFVVDPKNKDDLVKLGLMEKNHSDTLDPSLKKSVEKASKKVASKQDVSSESKSE